LSGVRITRRPRICGDTIAASFVLLARREYVDYQVDGTAKDADRNWTRKHVLAIDVPAMSYGRTEPQVVDFYKERYSVSMPCRA